MFRRTNGRSPPLLLGGLILFIIILSYSYWTLNIQNNDTLRSLENLQTNLKIKEVNLEKNSKKVSTLLDQLREKEEGLTDCKSKLSQQETDLLTINDDMKKRDYEMQTLNNEIQNLKDKLAESEVKISEMLAENEKLAKDSDIVISQRDDAMSAISKRDEQISALERKIQTERIRNAQLDANMNEISRKLASSISENSKLENEQKEAIAAASANGVKTGSSRKQTPSSSTPKSKADQNAGVAPKPIDDKNNNNDNNNQQEQGVLPQPNSDNDYNAQHQQNGQPLPADHIQAPPVNAPGRQDDAVGVIEKDVLAPPPDFDNLDAAIDEGNQFGEDPLMPDQDPEGGDVAGNEKLLEDDRVHENRVHDDGQFDRRGHLKNAPDNGAEIETGDKNDVDGEEDMLGDEQLDDGAINDDDNLAKENFFDEEAAAPLRLNMNQHNNDVLASNVKNPLDDRMVL